MSLINNFPIEDVTYKPTRMQSEVAEELPPEDSVQSARGDKFKSYTLQSAIEYYREHSSDSQLNRQTAHWLSELHEHLDDIRKKQREKADRILKENEEEL